MVESRFGLSHDEGRLLLPLSSDITVGCSHPNSPTSPTSLLVRFLTYIFLFSNHMAPLVAAAPPTFLACPGNKSRKCYRKEFTRHGVTFLAMSFNHILSVSLGYIFWRFFLPALSQILSWLSTPTLSFVSI